MVICIVQRISNSSERLVKLIKYSETIAVSSYNLEDNDKPKTYNDDFNPFVPFNWSIFLSYSNLLLLLSFYLFT